MSERLASSVLASLGLSLSVHALACSAGGGGYFAVADGGTPEASAEEAPPARDASSGTEDPEPEDAAAAEPLGCKQTPTGAFLRVDGNPSGSLADATGGKVADGHYVLKQAIVMSSGTQPKLAADLWLQGGRYEWQTKNSDGWHYSYGGTVKYSGTRMVMTVDCGGQQSAPNWAYSVSGNELTVQFTNINGFSWMYILRRVP